MGRSLERLRPVIYRPGPEDHIGIPTDLEATAHQSFEQGVGAIDAARSPGLRRCPIVSIPDRQPMHAALDVGQRAAYAGASEFACARDRR